MDNMKADFQFDESYKYLDESQNVFVEIPRNITSRDELFDVYVNGLCFPDYFGKNWDAFSDCLQDLSWLDLRSIVIAHSDIPRLPEEQLKIYLDILSESVTNWRADEIHELTVFFPRDAKDRLIH